MTNSQWHKDFMKLATPLIADACLRLGVDLRLAPPGIRSLIPGKQFAGRAIPVRHYGSVDILFEALEEASQGDILVIDNAGRTDEACVGDLMVMEAKASGLAAMIVWGLHRDTTDLLRIGWPIFSYGAYPAGPQRLDRRPANALAIANFGPIEVASNDLVFADDDGVVFVPEAKGDEILSIAAKIWETERRQAKAVESGETLREQLQFKEYLAKRTSDHTYTFRDHLKAVGGAIEE